MTRNSKRELLEAIRPRYRRANKAEKTRILDEFVAITGYHRKHAIRLLKHGVKSPGKRKRGRPKVHTGEVISALIKIWKVCDCICSKRLHPFLPEMMAVLEREEELALSVETKRSLLQMSPATMDRCLQSVGRQQRRGWSIAKPGTLFPYRIPVGEAGHPRAHLCRLGRRPPPGPPVLSAGCEALMAGRAGTPCPLAHFRQDWAEPPA